MISRRVDKLINLLKWPVAFASAALTPLLAWAFLRLLGDVMQRPWNLMWFCIGVFAFVSLWRSWLASNRFGNWLIQFEHELTHLIFAVATFHPIVGFRASPSKGSHVRFLGKGNWLITVGPYFFPTAAVFLWCIACFLPFGVLFPWTSLILGIAVGYHCVSTFRETHWDQTDLQELTAQFCWMFLPSSNLLVLGILIAYSHDGFTGIHQFTTRMIEPLSILYGYAKDVGAGLTP